MSQTDSTGGEQPFVLGRFAPTLAVSDVKQAQVFYAAVFGLEVAFENGDPVGFCILRRDAAELHLTLDRAHKGSTANVAHLLVDGVDAVHERAVHAGARIIKRMRSGVGAGEGGEGGLRAFVLADPFGNRIDVGERE